MIDFAKLKAPFPPERISWRVGPTNKDKTKGMALAYIDSRDVQERLDEVCGPENWASTYPHANGKTVCAIGIKCGDEWVFKADGAGDTDMEAEKGALSTAFKRSAVHWGIGRYLYDIPSPWVKITEHKQIDESELPKLRALLEGKKPSQKPATSGSAPTMQIVYPSGKSSQAQTVTAWLDLYEQAAEHFGYGPLYDANSERLIDLQVKVTDAGMEPLAKRIKKIFDTTHAEGKAA